MFNVDPAARVRLADATPPPPPLPPPSLLPPWAPVAVTVSLVTPAGGVQDSTGFGLVSRFGGT
jgi:hypothetical protein